MIVREDILEREQEFRYWAEIEQKGIKELSQLLNCSTTSVYNYADKLNIILHPAKRGRPTVENLKGTVFKEAGLKVLERDFHPPFQSHETAWKCQCIYCKEVKTYRKYNLDNGIGCQCRKDIVVGRGYKKWNIGDVFGFLEIIDRGKDPRYVKCRCQCGTVRDVRLAHLYGNHHSRTISCGCYQRSSGELKIREILENNNIIFKEQYTIPELSKYMRFDFAIFNDKNELLGLIEYNGEQHYNPIEIWGGEEKLIEQQKRDQRKVEYCKDNKIPLLVIPYWEYDNITLEYLMSDIRK